MTTDDKALATELRKLRKFLDGSLPRYVTAAALVIQKGLAERDGLLKDITAVLPLHEWDTCNVRNSLPCNCALGPVWTRINATLKKDAHMTDTLVERLDCDCDSESCTLKDAKDRIIALEAEVARLLGVLTYIRETSEDDHIANKALAALEARND